ncbi:thioredoxin domain-containing protein [bacterium]|nr:thioredoxin domain-containing protein [bacterium]
MQSKSREPLLNTNLKAIIALFFAVIIIILVLFRNIFFQSTYLLKSFGELSVQPEIAFKNNKPTFLEFYAEWCEVCKEMAPKVSALKDEFQEDINFVFLNVDNQKWDNYIRKFDVNGIPQVNLLDTKGNLISSYIGKQEEITLKDSLNQLREEAKSRSDVINAEFSVIKQKKKNAVTPRSHG